MTAPSSIPSDWLLLDLETAQDGRILKIGAARGADRFYQDGRCETPDALNALDALAAGAVCVAGHNIVEHDLPILAGRNPKLALLSLPVIDTLALSPICFPEHPDHHLIKDYKLVSAARNDPVSDALLAGELLKDEWASLSGMKATAPDAFIVLHGLLCGGACAKTFLGRGLSLYFGALGAPKPPEDLAARAILKGLLARLACRSAFPSLGGEEIRTADGRRALAYALAWLRVAGANSVLPAWVRHRYPQVSLLLATLRDVPCNDSGCEYCQVIHNQKTQLKRHFGFDGFRETPVDAEGRSLQRQIVRAGMQNQSLLAIMPTGGGKSLCCTFRRNNCAAAHFPTPFRKGKLEAGSWTKRTASRSGATISARITCLSDVSFARWPNGKSPAFRRSPALPPPPSAMCSRRSSTISVAKPERN